MYESSKATVRRGYDRRYATRYFVGNGIDIGAGADSIGHHRPFFPAMRELRAWDKEDGDAMLMSGVADGSFDFVHSSHCLEHLDDPAVALGNWIRICKPGGHLVIVVPDEDLYEQGIWPSAFNYEHQWSFTLGKDKSWSPKSISLVEFLTPFLPEVSILRVELLDINFFYELTQRVDQSLFLGTESAIELVLRRYDTIDRSHLGRYPR